MPAQTSPSPPGDAWKQAESGQGPALEREGETRQRPHCSRPHTITTTACPPTPSTTTISAADRMMMGGERNQTRERVETPSSQTVGGVSCLPAGHACFGSPDSCCHQSMGLFGFSTSPHPMGQVRGEPRALPVTRRPRQEREKAGSRAAAGQETSPTSLLAFISILDIVVSFLGPISSPPPAPPFPLRFLLLPLASPPPRSLSCGVGELRR